MAEQNLHVRLQQYCDCFVESDLEAELEKFVGGCREPVDQDETEAALKVLAFSILTALERRAERISLNTKQIGLLGNSRGLLATFSPDLIKRACEIIREISGVRGTKKQGRISLGLRGDELALSVECRTTEDRNELIINLPSL